MDQTETFIVVPFTRNEAGLKPGRPRRFADPDHARRWALLLGEVKAGIMVLAQPEDPAAEPRLAFHMGEIPADLFDHADGASWPDPTRSLATLT